MTPDTTNAVSSRAQIVRELYELIAALDRRVPQVERVGEISIEGRHEPAEELNPPCRSVRAG